MKKKLIFFGCLLLAASCMLTGCETPDKNKAAETGASSQAAESSAAEEPSQAETEQSEKPEKSSLSPEEKLAQAQAQGLTKYAKYNAYRDEFYDSRHLEWDDEKKEYRHVNNSPKTPPVVTEEVEIPEGLQSALDVFAKAMEQYEAEHPEFAGRSDYIDLDDTEALRTLERETAVQYFETYLAMAQCRNPNRHLGTHMVTRVLHMYRVWRETSLDNKTISEKGGDLKESALYLQEATDAVNAVGAGITAEDCKKLQRKYGYLIAPALQEMGKLDLLQIDPDSPCQNAEQIAAFAKCFA